MKMKTLCMENFRQFYGSHRLEFSADAAQRITVIHGENGSGKTSLLNAFKWCFYGRTDFDTGEENILNEHAIAVAEAGHPIPLSVEVAFDHDGFHYVARRDQAFRKIEDMAVEAIGGAVLELSWTDPSGKYEKSTNPESHINQILPETMHSYFFFNGERIEKLAYASASHEIRQAIKTLMGLEIVERARQHLNGKVKRHFSKQVQEGASQELSQVIEHENELENEIEAIKGEIETESQNIQACSEDIQVISNKLKSSAAAALLQAERDRLDQRRIQIEKDRAGISVDLRQMISERGFLAFIPSVAKQVDELLEEKRQKGELPYQIKQQFIDDLLQQQQCICGAQLLPGSDAATAVEQYKQSASGENIEEAFITTSGALKQVQWSRDGMFQQIRNRLQKRAELKEERLQVLGRLDEIGKQIEESGEEEAVALENRRAERQHRKDIAISHRAVLLTRLKDLEQDLADVQARRKELAKKSGQAVVARQRHEIAEECARVLGELHDALSRRTREQLSKRVDNTFRKILQKDYWAEIDDDYCLQIYKDIPGHGKQIVHEKSTGESQVTSLSFIGSIVSLAKEQHEKERQFFRGGVYPIIMDSPFGALDPTYREMIARYIPDLADQIILLVSGTQWSGEVERECKSRTGKHVSLIYSSPKVPKDKESYYVRSGAEYEHTLFEEGYHG